MGAKFGRKDRVTRGDGGARELGTRPGLRCLAPAHRGRADRSVERDGTPAGLLVLIALRGRYPGLLRRRNRAVRPVEGRRQRVEARAMIAEVGIHKAAEHDEGDGPSSGMSQRMGT